AGVLVDAEVDPAALEVVDGLRHVQRHGAGLRVRHEATGAEHAAQATDLAHEVRGGDRGVEVGVAGRDLLDQLVAADLGRTSGLGLRGARTGGEHDAAGGLAGAVRQADRAAGPPVGLAGVDAEPERHLDGGVELGGRTLLGETHGLGGGVETATVDRLSGLAVALAARGHLLLLALSSRGAGPRGPSTGWPPGDGREVRGPQSVTAIPIDRAVPAMILAAASRSR